MSRTASDIDAHKQVWTMRRAWHQSIDSPNIFPDGVPLERIRDRFTAWQAESVPLWMRVPAGEGDDFHGMDETGFYTNVKVEGKQIVRHGDTKRPFGVFSDTYRIHQHSDTVVRNVETLLEGTGELIVGSVGELDHGAIAWLSVEMRDTIKLDEYGIDFLPRLLAIGSHNGKHSTTYKRTVTNVVCRNTMAMALSEKTEQQFKIKHSSRSDLKLMQAREALDLLDVTGQTFAASATEAVQTSVTNKQWFQFLDAIVPVPDDKGAPRTKAQNKQAELNNLWVNDRRVAPWRGTAWGVVQAGNTWEQWGKTAKGATREERNDARTIAGDFDAIDRGTITTLNKILANA